MSCRVFHYNPDCSRTSPVTVPSANRLRQRQESTSSLSVGSWQMVTGTGSFRESVNELHSHHLQQNPTTSVSAAHSGCHCSAAGGVSQQAHHPHRGVVGPAGHHLQQQPHPLLAGSSSNSSNPGPSGLGHSASTPNANQSQQDSGATSIPSCCTASIDSECFPRRVDLFAM